MTQEIINRLKEAIKLRERGDTSEYNSGFDAGLRAAETVVIQTLTNLTPSGVERIRALVREMEELPEDLRLIVALTDDGRKLRAMLESAALPSEPPSQGDVEGRARLTGPEINRLQCAAAFLRSGCFPMPGYADDVEAAIRALASKEDGRS